MTIDQKVEAFRMRLEGYTLEEIGQRFGFGREYIRQNLMLKDARAKKKRCFDGYIYPNLARWLSKERNSYTSFAKSIGVSPSKVFNALTGRVDMSKSTIDKILGTTGMSYEEAFYLPKQEGPRC